MRTFAAAGSSVLRLASPWAVGAALLMVLGASPGGVVAPTAAGPHVASPTAFERASLAAHPTAIHPTSSVVGPYNGHFFQNVTYPATGVITDSAFATVDPTLHEVFATNGNGDDLAAFYESNGTLIGQVAAGNPLIGEYAQAVALNPTSHLVFVGVYVNGARPGFLLMYNETTLRQVGVVNFAGAPTLYFQPFVLTYDPASNQLFAVNSTDGLLAAINASTGIVTKWIACTVAFCQGDDLVAAPNLHELALATGQNAIVLYNTTNDHMITTITTTNPQFYPITLAYNPATFTLYAANFSFSGNTLFYRFNLISNSFSGSLPGDPSYANWMAYDAADNALLIENFSTSCPGVVSCTYGFYDAIELVDAGTGIVLGHFQALGAYGASFGKMAIDPGTANLVLPGSFSAPTTALSLPTLNIAHTYGSYASYSGSTVANPTRGTFVTFGQYPTQLQARVEATGAVAWTTPLPSFAPASLEPPMAIDTQAGVVFLADGVSGNVLTVNADTGSPGAAIPLPLGMNVTALAVDSLHHFLYVAENPGQVQVFSSVTGALAGTAMTPFLTACAGTADSVRLAAYFVNCQPNGNVTTVRSGTFNTGTIYAVGNDPTSIVLDPSGELIVANFVSDNLTTIALANGARAAIPLGPGNPLLLAEDVPDGLLAVADGSSALVQMLNVSDGLPYANAWAGNATGGLTFDNTSGAFVLVGLNTSSATVWSRLSVPSAPGGPVVVASNNTLSVNWTAVAGANGQVLYNVTLTPSVGAPMRLINTSALQHTFTGLTDGVVYAVTVTAGNFVGTGPSAGPVDAAPIGIPYPPSSLTATAHGSSAVVVWGAPASTDGSPVTNYTLEYALGTGPVLSISEGTVLSATIPGLLPGSFYTFHVIAWNAAGASNSSASAALATPTSSVSVPGGFAGSTLALGVGIGAIVVFAALVVVFLVRRRPGPPGPTPASPPSPMPAPLEVAPEPPPPPA